jgi:hypothetical protein
MARDRARRKPPSPWRSRPRPIGGRAARRLARGSEDNKIRSPPAGARAPLVGDVLVWNGLPHSCRTIRRGS